MKKEVIMDDFIIDLNEAEELPTIESPWYALFGSGAVLVVLEEARK